MSNEWDGARGCLLQAIDDLKNMYGASDTEVLRGLREILNGWIDPQRIVDIAKRYTDYNRPGKVEIIFVDGDQDIVKCWSVYKGTRRDPMWFDGHTLDAALKGAGA